MVRPLLLKKCVNAVSRIIFCNNFILRSLFVAKGKKKLKVVTCMKCVIVSIELLVRNENLAVIRIYIYRRHIKTQLTGMIEM